MAKTKKEQQQEEIGDAVVIGQLQRDIKILRKLPDDFRNLSPGSREWQEYERITGHTESMQNWLRGPVLILQPISKMEAKIWATSPPRKYFLHEQKIANVIDLFCVITEAEESECSFVFLPEVTRKVIDAVNALCREYGCNVRAEGKFTNEKGERY